MKNISFTFLLLFLSFAAFAQVAPITGSLNACPGATSTLSDATPGGVWTSTVPGVAIVGLTTGVVSALSTGVTTISYTVGSSSVTATFTVLATPAAITGASTVCVGATAPLSCSTSGGTWYSSAPGVGTISTSGVVGGISPGVTTIYYTVGTCSSIKQMTVNAAPAPITGPTTVCAGSSITVTSTTPGGSWSSSNPAVGTIDYVTGIMYGVSAGTTMITYVLPTGCATTTTITVLASPTVSASATAACGGTYTMTALGALAYTWSPSTGLSCPTCSSTTINPTATTIYTVTGIGGSGCSGTATVSVNGNRIAGHVGLSGSGSIRVWLVKYNPVDSSIIATDSVMTCSYGGGEYYEFASPAAGSYRVKAYLLGGTPGSSGYIPTYGGSFPNWYTADTLVHGTGTDTMHVSLIYGTVPSGPGFISGYVYSGAGKGTTGEVPAPGMLVYLKNASGNIITYVYTDASGNYSFSGLGYGTYYVYPEAYKYYTTPSATLTLSATTPGVSGVGFKQRTSYGTIIPWVATAVKTNAGGELAVYPNPTTGELIVNGVAKDHTEYRMLDMTGKCVMAGVMQQGRNTCSISKLPAGTYTLELAGEHGQKDLLKVVKE